MKNNYFKISTLVLLTFSYSFSGYDDYERGVIIDEDAKGTENECFMNLPSGTVIDQYDIAKELNLTGTLCESYRGPCNKIKYACGIRQKGEYEGLIHNSSINPPVYKSKEPELDSATKAQFAKEQEIKEAIVSNGDLMFWELSFGDYGIRNTFINYSIQFHPILFSGERVSVGSYPSFYFFKFLIGTRLFDFTWIDNINLPFYDKRGYIETINGRQTVTDTSYLNKLFRFDVFSLYSHLWVFQLSSYYVGLAFGPTASVSFGGTSKWKDLKSNISKDDQPKNINPMGVYGGRAELTLFFFKLSLEGGFRYTSFNPTIHEIQKEYYENYMTVYRPIEQFSTPEHFLKDKYFLITLSFGINSLILNDF
jgi:hypothetical protein